MKLISLTDGSPFMFKGKNPVFRNLYLVKGGDCRCKIIGERKIDGQNWSDFQDDCSPSAEVEFDGTRDRIEITQSDLGINSVVKNKPKKAVSVNLIKIDKPKKVKQSFDIPFDSEFTVKELAAKFNVEPYSISNELARRKKANNNYLKVVRTISGGKGKPQCVFILSK